MLVRATSFFVHHKPKRNKSFELPDGTQILPAIASPSPATVAASKSDTHVAEKDAGDTFSTPRKSLETILSVLKEKQFDLVEKWVFCKTQDKMGLMFNDRMPIGRQPSSPATKAPPDSVRFYGGSVSLDSALSAAWDAGTKADHLNSGKAGMAGRVATSNTPEIHSDITANASFYRVDMARRLDIKGAIALPLVRNNETHTVLIFFTRREIAVDPALAEGLLRACVETGLSGHMKMVVQHDLDTMTTPRRRTSVPSNDSFRGNATLQQAPSTENNQSSSPLIASPPPTVANARSSSAVMRARIRSPCVPPLSIAEGNEGDAAATVGTDAAGTSASSPLPATTEPDQTARIVKLEATVIELQQTVIDLRQEITLLTDMVLFQQSAPPT